MSIIRLTVDGQRLIQQESPVIASQGILEDSVVFDFSSEWSGFGKVALFWREEDESREDIYQVIVDENNSAVVPWEVTQTDGEICITVFGTKDIDQNDIYSGSVLTAEIIRYKIVEGLYSEGQGSEPPSPEIYQQILAIVGEVNEKFNESLNDIAVVDARVDNIIAEQTSGMLSGCRIIEVDIENVQLDSGGDVVIPLDPSTYTWITNANAQIISVTGLYETTTYKNYAPSDGYWAIQKSNNNLQVHFSHASWASKTVTVMLYVLIPYTEDLTELTDIRVAADSTTYQTAGAAVRAQVTDLQDQIDELRG